VLSPQYNRFMRQSTICTNCGHLLLVHLARCQVQYCQCKEFAPPANPKKLDFQSFLAMLATDVSDRGDEPRDVWESGQDPSEYAKFVADARAGKLPRET
jgi:hypothetical protein